MIKELITKANTIGVISHINPDADNLGSLTALSTSLRLLGKDVKSICIDTIPYNLQFLHDVGKLTSNYDMDLDMLFILDCSSVDRLGHASSLIERTDIVINIDHHISNNIEADYSIVEVAASSTGEVLYKFLKEINLPIDVNVAESLFTAISGDSGSFRYDTVTSETFTIASELLDLGVNNKKINNNLYAMNKIAKVQMLGLAIDRLKIIPQKKLGITYILIDDFEELGAADADVEGIVEYIRDIDDIEIAILLRQNSAGFKASTRSKENYDVSELSLKFGGGGHIRAAGFSIKDLNLEETIEEILKRI
ncbi:MAG: bifunctional oligoribonuclease/PAP phosphatase NrnA [Tissierellia bacterium]|nr:bifunctional oligoribonuclease/PAP phosphatase NrnA [Tissierellia bacterium]